MAIALFPPVKKKLPLGIFLTLGFAVPILGWTAAPAVSQPVTQSPAQPFGVFGLGQLPSSSNYSGLSWNVPNFSNRMVPPSQNSFPIFPPLFSGNGIFDSQGRRSVDQYGRDSLPGAIQIPEPSIYSGISHDYVDPKFVVPVGFWDHLLTPLYGAANGPYEIESNVYPWSSGPSFLKLDTSADPAI